MASQSGSYQSINVSVNGVIKHLMIPYSSLPTAPTIPTAITVSPDNTQDLHVNPTQVVVVPNTCQPPVVVVSSNCQTPVVVVPSSGSQQSTGTRVKSITLTVSRSSAQEGTVAVSTSAPKLTSLLSTVRLPSISSPGTRTLVTLRPKSRAASVVSEPPKTLPATVSVPSTPFVKPVVPGEQRRLPILKAAIRPRQQSVNGTPRMPVIRAARIIRPMAPSIIQQPVSVVATDGHPRTRYVVQPVTGQVVSTGASPAKVMVVSGSSVPVTTPKRMVTIRMPLNSGDASGPSGRQTIQVKPGFTMIELTDSESNLVKYIPIRRKEEEDKQGVAPTSAAAALTPMEEDAPTAEDIKIIEIIPDDDEAAHSQEEDGGGRGEEDGGGREEEDGGGRREEDGGGVTAAGSVDQEQLELKKELSESSVITGLHLDQTSDPAHSQDSVNFSPTPKSPRPGIFETLNSMSLEEASAAVTALTLPQEDPPKTLVDNLASDPSLNIVLRGDDHVVIENPGYSDEDDDVTISADEGGLLESHLVISESYSLATDPLVISESYSLATNPQRGVPTESSASSAIAENGEKQNLLRGKNVAKRTGGKPQVYNKAKRTGGKPMTIKERHGVDVKDCCVSLEKLYNTKPYVKWVERHLCHILCCKNGKPGMHLKRLQKKRSDKEIVPDPGWLYHHPDSFTPSRPPRKMKSLPKKAAVAQRAGNMKEDDTKEGTVELSDFNARGNESSEGSLGFGGTVTNVDESKSQSPDIPSPNGKGPTRRSPAIQVRRPRKRKSEPAVSTCATDERDGSSANDGKGEEMKTGTTDVKRRRKGEARRSINLPFATSSGEPMGFSVAVSTGQKKIDSIVPRKLIIKPSPLATTAAGGVKVSAFGTLPVLSLGAFANGGNQGKSSTVSSTGQCQLATGVPKLRLPGTSNLSETKYYLVKTEGCSYLIPVSKTPASQNQVPSENVAHTVPIKSVRSPISSVLSLPDPSPSAAVGVEGDPAAESNAVQPDSDADYEPASAGMRQEDRISLLKEKLRQQQQRLENMRKKKD